MRGYVRQRSKGTWTLEIDAGVDWQTGKRKRIYRTMYGTKKQAKDLLSDIITDLNKKTYVEPSTMPFGQYLRDWFADHRLEIREKTAVSYEQQIEKHIIPDLGDVPLCDVDAEAIQKFLVRKLKGGRLDGKGGLSTATVRRIYVIINLALTQAKKTRKIPYNPASDVTPPKLRKSRMKFYTPDQVQKLLEFAKDNPVRKKEPYHRLYPYILLAVNTGMRPSEILGLTWDNVDLDAGLVYVVQSLENVEDRMSIEELKNDHSRRRIRLPQACVELLRQHQAKQKKAKKALSRSYHDGGLVFDVGDGRPWNIRNLRKQFYTLLDQAKLPRIRPYDLRHTHATLLAAKNNFVKVISAQLGHQSAKMTLDVYSHVTDDMQAQAAASMEEWGFNQPARKPQKLRLVKTSAVKLPSNSKITS